MPFVHRWGRERGGGIALANRVQENLEALEARPTLPSSHERGRRIIQALLSVPGRVVYAGARTGCDHAYNHLSLGSVD